MRVLAAFVAVVATLACTACSATTISTPPVGPAATGVCAPFAGIDPAHPPDTLPLTADPTLEAEFPTTIGADPVVDVASGKLVETLCVTGGQASVDAARRNTPAGVDLDAITVASATGTADGLKVTITAYRLPGHQGGELLPVLGFVSQSVAPGSARFTGDFEQLTIAGKPVSRWVDTASGAPSYIYATTDTLFVVSEISPSQANQVFAALP